MWLHEECLYLFYLFFFLFGTVLLSIQLCMVCRLILRWYVGSYAEFPLKCKGIFYYINSSSPKLLINHLKCFHFPVKQKLTIQWALWTWDYPCCGFFLVHACCCFSLQVVSNSCDPVACCQPGSALSSFPDRNTGVGCHLLLQGIFLTQGFSLRLLYWQVGSLPLNHLGSPCCSMLAF